METVGVSTLEPGVQAPQQQDGRRVGVKVQMLDQQIESFLLEPGAAGKVLFELVCLHLNLTEGDYFGLEYQDHRKITVWLDLLKPVFKQIRHPKYTVLRFVVKFFPPDPSQLMEELTRYLFALQVKRDLASGHLVCNDSSAALMVSHIIQSEIGDFDETQTWHHLLHNKYLPDQDELRGAITERHRQHAGQTPAESDYQLLEVARRLEMYGVRLHPAKDREGSRLSLAVCHTGVLVLQGYTRINAFNWSKIRKLSFKRKRFLIKLRSDPASSAHHDTLEFAMVSRDCCKAFWKACVEHHAFFRLLEEPKPPRRRRAVLLSRGSSFRFSGRTQKQIIDFVRDAELKKVPFERKHSKVVSHSSPSPPTTSRSHDAAQVSVSVVSSGHPDSSHQPDTAPGSGKAEASPTNGFHADSAVEAPPLLNTGPCRQQRGSSSSIPYIDGSDIDSEGDAAKRGSKHSNHSNHSNHGNDSSNCGLFGSINGFYHTNHQGLMQQQQGMMGNRNGILNKFNGNHESTDDDKTAAAAFQGRLPLHSTLLDEIFQGRDKRGGGVAGRPLASGTRSQCSSPVIASFHHRTSSLSYADGYAQPRRDDGGWFFPPPAPQNHYGSYSPTAPGRAPLQPVKLYYNDNNNVREQITDTASPRRHCGSAPTERRTIVTNGNNKNRLFVPGQARCGTPQRLFGKHGGVGGGVTAWNNHNLNQPVQMIDGSTSSESDSSGSESDGGSAGGVYGPPLVYGNPAAAAAAAIIIGGRGPTSSSPLLCNKFSLGSLQLEDGEGAESDEGFVLNQEELRGGRGGGGGGVYSC